MKRKYDDHLDDRKYYPTPVPTSSTGLFTSSPNSRRPASLQRTVSTLSERAPLGAVPSIDLPANGEPVVMGRSSNSSDYQLSANRLISRVHVRATYHAPAGSRLHGKVVVECLGWNGCKVHYRGEVQELAKGETFESDEPACQIMIDVQETRVLLVWPKPSVPFETKSPWTDESPVRRDSSNVDRFASSPPDLHPRLRSPESPTPANQHDANLEDTFIASESVDVADDGNVQVYEDQEEDDGSRRSVTPTPGDRTPTQQSLLQPPSARLLKSPSISSLSDPEDLSDHDEENDPIVHSFGPFGENLLSRFESFKSASPQRTRRIKQPLGASFSSPKRTAVDVDGSPFRQLHTSPIKSAIVASPIKNHVINQLAYSRVHSLPLSTIYNNLPSDMKASRTASGWSKMSLTTVELESLLDKVPCVGEIQRQGRDAAGKPLENEFYYVPEMDEDEVRKSAVSASRPGMRAARKQHKVNTIRFLSSLLPVAVVIGLCDLSLWLT